MIAHKPLQLPALRAWPIATASLRLFQRAPQAAAALCLLSTAAGLVMNTLGDPTVLAWARLDGNASHLALGGTAVLVGWAASCTSQGLWARLVFEAHQAQGVASFAQAWRKLGGAWTRLGLLVTYAVYATLVLYWPLVARRLQTVPQLPETVAGLLTAAGAFLVASALALWLGLRLSLMVPAAAMHTLSTRAAIIASWRLTRGRLLPLVSTSALIGAPSLALGLARTLLSPAPGSMSDVALRLGQVALSAAFGAAMPLFTLVAEPPANGDGGDRGRGRLASPSP